MFDLLDFGSKGLKSLYENAMTIHCKEASGVLEPTIAFRLGLAMSKSQAALITAKQHLAKMHNEISEFDYEELKIVAYVIAEAFEPEEKLFHTRDEACEYLVNFQTDCYNKVLLKTKNQGITIQFFDDTPEHLLPSDDVMEQLDNVIICKKG